jgi:hypothetical protein
MSIGVSEGRPRRQPAASILSASMQQLNIFVDNKPHPKSSSADLQPAAPIPVGKTKLLNRFVDN